MFFRYDIVNQGNQHTSSAPNTAASSGKSDSGDFSRDLGVDASPSLVQCFRGDEFAQGQDPFEPGSTYFESIGADFPEFMPTNIYNEDNSFFAPPIADTELHLQPLRGSMNCPSVSFHNSSVGCDSIQSEMEILAGGSHAMNASFTGSGITSTGESSAGDAAALFQLFVSERDSRGGNKHARPPLQKTTFTMENLDSDTRGEILDILCKRRISTTIDVID